jgi:hypothetical protein
MMRTETDIFQGIASTGFSGLLVFGIEDMDGDAGIAGWRWIFILVPIPHPVWNLIN